MIYCGSGTTSSRRSPGSATDPTARLLNLHIRSRGFSRNTAQNARKNSAKAPQFALPDGSNGGNPCGFLLTLTSGQKIYFACDTGLFGDMAQIGSVGLDLAVLPIGDLFTMGPNDALEAVKLLTPKKVIPSHYNTWPPIAQDANQWAERVRAETKSNAIVVSPGQTITF